MGPTEWLEKLGDGFDEEFELVDVRYTAIVRHKPTGVRGMFQTTQVRLDTLNSEVGPLNNALSVQGDIIRKIEEKRS